MKKRNFLSASLIFPLALCLVLSIFCTLSAYSQNVLPEPLARTVSFDDGWRFIRDSIAGAENPDFNDANWRILSVPHDWSIEDLPGQNGVDIIGPFDRSAIDKGSSGYLVGGTGWYRKKFTVSSGGKDKNVYIQFDGVYMNSDVWLNGKHLGFHPYGYTPFYYNITSYLNPPGKPNIVAVRVRNEGMNSRWYSGSGINRHVWLILKEQVHIDISGGLYITTPIVSENSAVVKVAATIVNCGNRNEEIQSAYRVA